MSLLAAGAYREQGALWGQVCNLLPAGESEEERWRKLCEHDRRRQMAALIREAKSQEERAVEQLEAARETLAEDGP